MAASDPLKADIFRSGGLPVLQQVLTTHSASAKCMEPGLGLLAALTLRHPEAASAAIQAGMPAVILQVRMFPSRLAFFNERSQNWLLQQRGRDDAWALELQQKMPYNTLMGSCPAYAARSGEQRTGKSAIFWLKLLWPQAQQVDP